MQAASGAGACALLALAALAAADVTIGVVEQEPAWALRLAAAVAAAGARGGARLARAEPAEPLSLAAEVCALGAAGAAAAVAGGGAAAQRLAAEAAARAALPLLLVEPSPGSAAWEALAMYPHHDVLAQACAELCRAKGWESGVVLHEAGGTGAGGAASLAARLPLLARQLPPPGDAALLRDMLLVLKKSGAVRFVVWCGAECAERVLAAAQRVGLLAERHAYVLLSLDLHTLRLDRYSQGGANLTALRLFDPESEEVRDAADEWRAQYVRRWGDAEGAARVARAPPLALLLAHQAAGLARRALAVLRLPPMPLADCATGRGAFHADTLLNYLRSEEWGSASWEADGARRAVRLDVVEVARGGALRRAGVWAPRAGLAWRRTDDPAPPPPPGTMTNLTFNVLIAMNNPYVMRHQSPERLSGNKRYEGFCIELIQRLADILHFNYTFVEQLDGDYGSRKENGEWTGMIGRLMDESEGMHFAITDLTITAVRERAVDFTTPFMNLGISILFRKPKKPEPELFAFLLPFSHGVWLCLGFAYLGTSLLLYVVGRLCHEEWQNPYPCIEDPPALENQFTLANALWFNLGAVLLQGSEIAPVAYGTRAVASVWWLFALVITSSYTANLATLLASQSTNEPIKNVEELAHNSLGITYGAKKGGSTYTFFEQSTNSLYREMYAHMQQHPQPTSNGEGIDWVSSNYTYAFLMESTTIEYEIERNCKVTKVGNPLDSKGYGIAMRKNSPYRQSLNLALLKLQEAGVLREMKNSWWIEKNGGGACKAGEEHASTELNEMNFRGLFLVLAVGCALGVVLSCLDLAYGAARRARHTRQPFLQRFAAELRFVFRFQNSVKPVQGPLSESSSEASVGAGAEAEAEAEECTRAGSLPSARRRRSSMHAASLRLARHTARDSATPRRAGAAPPGPDTPPH